MVGYKTAYKDGVFLEIYCVLFTFYLSTKGAAELLHSQLPFSIGLIVIGVILQVRSATMVKNG
jgi:hypothetical protein